MKVLSAACKGAGFIRIKGDLRKSLLFLRDRVVLGSPRILKATDRVCVRTFTLMPRATRAMPVWGASYTAARVSCCVSFPKRLPNPALMMRSGQTRKASYTNLSLCQRSWGSQAVQDLA